MPGYTHYEVLGVEVDATPEQIRSAYRALVQRVHPDGGGTAGVFSYVQTAYDVLSDPAQRREYDDWLKEGAHAGRDDFDGDSASSNDGSPEGTWRQEDFSEPRAGQRDEISFEMLRGRSFEQFLVTTLNEAGVYARLTPELVGIDLSAAGPDGRTVVQATGSASPIGQDIVWEINWAKDYYRADAAMVITNSTFSPAARAAASQSGVHLWDRQDLRTFLQTGAWSNSQEKDSWSRHNADPFSSAASTTTRAASAVPHIAAFARRRPVVTGLIVLVGILLLYGSQTAFVTVVFICIVYFGVRHLLMGS